MYRNCPIVIPAYEPDEGLIKLLKSFDKLEQFRIVIVNDGSSKEYDGVFDQARAIIEPYGGIVLTHEVNKGKGRALKTAFKYILDTMPDAIGVVTADSDGQHTVQCIVSIVDKLREDTSKFVLGVRCFDGEDIPWKSVFGNKLTMKVLKYASGLTLSDTQTGLRGINREFMGKLLDVRGERFEFETEMLLASSGLYPIVEVPIATIYDSKDNHKTHFNPIKDSIKIYKVLGRQFIGYMVSSVLSCVIDLVVFAICCRLLSGVGEYIVVSTIIARVISATFNFAVNYKKVFGSNDSVPKTALKYACLAVIQMMCSGYLVKGGVALTHITEVIVKIIVDTILFFISYKIQQKLVFKKKR